MTPAGVERRFVPLGHGAVHCAVAGSGRPVLLLHQTPRSWDEYRDVLPLLAAAGYRAIALDTPGFGDSAPLDAEEDSIESWARVAIGLLDALGIDRAAVPAQGVQLLPPRHLPDAHRAALVAGDQSALVGRKGQCAHLRAVAGEGVNLAADLVQFAADTDSAYVEKFFIPGLRKAGDFRAASVLTTHNPQAIASAAARPNPSIRDGNSSKSAAWYAARTPALSRTPK